MTWLPPWHCCKLTRTCQLLSSWIASGVWCNQVAQFAQVDINCGLIDCGYGAPVALKVLLRLCLYLHLWFFSNCPSFLTSAPPLFMLLQLLLVSLTLAASHQYGYLQQARAPKQVQRQTCYIAVAVLLRLKSALGQSWPTRTSLADSKPQVELSTPAKASNKLTRCS